MLRQLLTTIIFCVGSQSVFADHENKSQEIQFNSRAPQLAIQMPSSPHRFFANLPAGRLVPDVPVQQSLDTFKWLKNGKYQLGYTDHFIIQGLVLSKRRYLNDERADIAPYDLVVGWQRMSDPEVIRNISIYQNYRFYFWRVDEFPIPRDEIENSSTNLHLIPDNEQIKAQLSEIRRGDVVTLSGYLTDVKDENQFVWATSRSREDSGDGACEILLIKEIEIIRLKDN